MSTLLRLTLLMLLSFFFVVSCNITKSSDPSEASPAAKVKKVKVGSQTMTLEEEEEDDLEQPSAQAIK